MTPYLHVFAQFTHHAEARIVGSKKGLDALADAIAIALKDGDALSEPVFVNDGEGFRVEVKCASDAEVEKLDDPYYSTFVSDEVTYWRDRAFKAEAERSALRNAAAA